MNLPKTEKELEAYFKLNQLVVLRDISMRFHMKDCKPVYDEKAIIRYNAAKEEYLKLVNDMLPI